MILTFADSETEKVFHRTYSKKLPSDLQKRARNKLLMIDAATNINDLRMPPGNRLEMLRGDREDQYSIRINRRWRVCFTWRDADAYDVEITDYH